MVKVAFQACHCDFRCLPLTIVPVSTAGTALGCSESQDVSPEFKTTSFLKAIHLKYIQDNTNSPYYELSDAYMCTDKIMLLDAEKASEFQLIKQLIKVGHISKAHLMLHA